MYIEDVLEKCRERNHPMTKMGIYKAGESYGFITRKDNQHALEFDKEKFLEWLDKATEEIPSGWMTLREISEELKISISQVYRLSKNPRLELRHIGAGRGVLYVNPERFREIISENSKNHKYDWGGEDGKSN